MGDDAPGCFCAAAAESERSVYETKRKAARINSRFNSFRSDVCSPRHMSHRSAAVHGMMASASGGQSVLVKHKSGHRTNVTRRD